ncbi:hypothetical protein WJX82_010100 [Trebouxia sp. C0006]
MFLHDPEAFKGISLLLNGIWATQHLALSSAAPDPTQHIIKPASRLLLQAGVQDGLGQTVTADWPTSSPPQLQAQGPADDPTNIYGQTSAQVDTTGMVQFQDLLLRAPEAVYNICFAAVSSLQEVKPSCVSVQVRGCQLGEVVGAEGNVCDPCLPGQYSSNTMSPTCDMTCPDSADCMGAMVLPSEGYWHSAAKATLIHPCPNQAACQGSRAALQECAATWYTTPDPHLQALLRCQLYAGAGSSSTSASSYLDLQCSSGYEGRLCSICVVMALQGLLTYTQLASILGMLNVQWPTVLQGLFEGFSWVTHIAPKVVALDCLLQHHSTSSLPLSAALNQFSCYQIDSSIPLNIAYPQFLQATWQAGYWVENMRYACFTGRHLAVALGLGLPALLLLGLGIPLLFAFMVWRHRLELDSAPCRQRLGFAYRSYKSCFWWESSALQLKQLGLLLVVVGRPLGTYNQTLIVLTLVVSEVAYELVFHPARHRRVEYMQAAAIGLLVYAALTVLLLADYQNQAAQAGLAATGILVGVANVLMCVLYLYCMARASRGKVREYVFMGEEWVYGKFHRQLAPYASFVRTRSLASGRSLDTAFSLEMALSGVPFVSETGGAARRSTNDISHPGQS